MPRVFEDGFKQPATPKKKVGTLHKIHILDGSTSMAGLKFTNAVKGINEDIKSSIDSAAKEGVDLTISAYQFATELELTNPNNFTKIKPKDFQSYNPRMLHGWTRLYGSVGEVLEFVRDNKGKDDAALVNIFTDGEENRTPRDHRYYDPNNLSKLIKDLEANHNFTVTFVGTEFDVDNIVKKVGIYRSNTAVHDNTAEGIGETYKLMARKSKGYVAKYAAGAAVGQNFFSND